MAFVDRIVQYPGRVIARNVLTSEETTFDLSRDEGTITTEGTLLNAANLNRETQVDADVQAKYDAVLGDVDYQNPMSNDLDFLAISEETIQQFVDLGMTDPRE